MFSIKKGDFFMSEALLFLGIIGTSIAMFIIFTIGIIRIEISKSKKNQSVNKIIMKMFIGMGICLFIQFYYSIVLSNLQYFIYTVIGIICCFAAIVISYCEEHIKDKI